MPIVVKCETSDSIDVGTLVEYMSEHKVSPADHAAMVETAPMLRKLGNNRRFLADIVTEQLKNYHDVRGENQYGPQVIMIYNADGKMGDFFLRACCWPSRHDQLIKTSGEDIFFYNRPHDHNFNFLTVGYYGPGYWSNYYTYDYGSVTGVEAEPVRLKFVEKSHLSEGKVMLYRAFIDIHDQLPSDSFSVSLNIMENTLRSQVADQYVFDIQGSRIKGFANKVGAGPLFDVVAVCGSDSDREVLAYIAGHHASGRVQCCAWKALADATSTPRAAIETLSQVPDTAPAMVKGWARNRLTDLERLVAEQS